MTKQNEWYVLRVTYQRELAAHKLLDDNGITNFVPTILVRRNGRDGKFKWERKAAIHNYVFVHADKTTIQSLKTNLIPYLRYVMTSVNGQSRIQTVPEWQMRNFIAVAGNAHERALFLDPLEVNLSRGDSVRITGGPFEGVEGTFISVRNEKEKRVVVKIEGIAAVATTVIPASLVEKL